MICVTCEFVHGDSGGAAVDHTRWGEGHGGAMDVWFVHIGTTEGDIEDTCRQEDNKI